MTYLFMYRWRRHCEAVSATEKENYKEKTKLTIQIRKHKNSLDLQTENMILKDKQIEF